MYNVGDTFTPTPMYAKSCKLNMNDVYTICKIDRTDRPMVYWDGPGLDDLGGYGDGVGAQALSLYLIPYSISLENK